MEYNMTIHVASGEAVRSWLNPTGNAFRLPASPYTWFQLLQMKCLDAQLRPDVLVGGTYLRGALVSWQPPCTSCSE